jgi:hypothetical protein
MLRFIGGQFASQAARLERRTMAMPVDGRAGGAASPDFRTIFA